MTVHLFGNLADLTEKEHIDIDYPATTDKLVESLIALYPELTNHKFRVAVNQELIYETRELQPDDEIALLPPFSGG